MRRQGAVARSTCPNHRIACSRESPHMSGSGCKDPHTDGRSGCPKRAQRSSAVSCTQRTPAGLPAGMPGMGDEMDGAMQHAAQCGRQAGTGNAEGMPTLFAVLATFEALRVPPGRDGEGVAA